MNFMKDFLQDFCEANQYDIREYSGRNFARDCVGIVIPRRSQSLFGFYTAKAISEIGDDTDSKDRENFFELLEDFLKGAETDEMGRDDIILYNRHWKYAEWFPEEVLEDSEN